MLHRGTRWVMRVSRLAHCRDDEAATQFVKVFASWGLTASPSRLSRWEYGHSRGNPRLLRAYEEGCGLPPFLLFALNDRQVRANDDTFADVASIEATDFLKTEDIYAILDRALSDDTVHGSDWYQLASFAASHKYFYLSHSNTRIVARRLIEELARSLGAAYILRFEALHLLASQSRIHDALVEQLMEMFEDESTGAVGDAVSLILRAAPSVRDVLATRIRESDSPMASQSRIWMTDILRDRKPDAGEMADGAAVSALADELCRDLPKWAMAHIECDMTWPLVSQALGGRSRLKRHEASLLLMLVEIQAPLCGRLLDSFERETDPLLRTRLANLLEYQVPASQPLRLASLALAEVDPEARRSLWAARGHVLEQIGMTPPIAAQLAEPGSQFAVSYALGISGSADAALQGRTELPGTELPGEVLGMLEWWKQRGPTLLD